MTSNVDRISYALAKQVPSMQYGFTIQTDYGDLYIAGKDALPFVALAELLLQKQYLATSGGTKP